MQGEAKEIEDEDTGKQRDNRETGPKEITERQDRERGPRDRTREAVSQ